MWFDCVIVVVSFVYIHNTLVTCGMELLTKQRTCLCLNPGSQYDAGAYVASVASSLVHNMTLEHT